MIGLAASKLMEEYYRPVAVVTIDGDRARGSVRSIPGFHITEALESCRDVLERYGGHAAAAGFTLPAGRLPELRERLEQLAGESLRGRPFNPVLSVDSEVRISELTWDLHRWISRLEPCGQGNPSPVFFTRGAQIRSKRCVGKDNSHLKMTLSDGRTNIDAIAFGFGHMEKSLLETVDVAFALEENDYYGKQMQMRVIDIQGEGDNSSPMLRALICAISGQAKRHLHDHYDPPLRIIHNFYSWTLYFTLATAHIPGTQSTNRYLTSAQTAANASARPIFFPSSYSLGLKEIGISNTLAFRLRIFAVISGSKSNRLARRVMPFNRSALKTLYPVSISERMLLYSTLVANVSSWLATMCQNIVTRCLEPRNREPYTASA